MSILISIIIPIAAAFLGVWAGRRYDAFVLNRQEKAILVLLVQEFALLLQRTEMYYRQMLDAGISFSTLFEASDSSTFVKLAEVSTNTKVVESVLNLKADFFQVIRYANKASEAAAKAQVLKSIGKDEDADDKLKEAKIAQGMAVTFFMGNLMEEGLFHRNRYKEYINNLRYIINYLKTINELPWFFVHLLRFMPKIRWEKEALDNFVALRRKKLSQTKKELATLRENEKNRLKENSPYIIF